MNVCFDLCDDDDLKLRICCKILGSAEYVDKEGKMYSISVDCAPLNMYTEEVKRTTLYAYISRASLTEPPILLIAYVNWDNEDSKGINYRKQYIHNVEIQPTFPYLDYITQPVTEQDVWNEEYEAGSSNN